MTDPASAGKSYPHGPEPAVYARLSEEAEVRMARRATTPATRWVGWAISLAIVVAVVLAALRAHPW